MSLSASTLVESCQIWILLFALAPPPFQHTTRLVRYSDYHSQLLHPLDLVFHFIRGIVTRCGTVRAKGIAPSWSFIEYSSSNFPSP